MSSPIAARWAKARSFHHSLYPPERIAETRPDAILILPWNLEQEIASQLAYTAEWGAELIVPIPTARVVRTGGALDGAGATALT